MVAVDLLDSQGNFDPKLRDGANRPLRARILQEAFLRGLLLLGCGKAAIRFCPPLVIDSDQIQTALQILFEVLAEIPC
jgi:4-aminobutyrate aminotransferase